MSLWQKAYETYENHEHLVGQVREGEKQPLCAVGHMILKMQLEVTIQADGTFVSAREIAEDDSRTMIPATDKSANRTSGACAHPLSDSLQYLTEIDEKRQEMYLQQLRGWASSAYSHPKLTAILRYIEGKTLLHDLQACGLLKLQENGLPEKNCKIAKTDAVKAMVRWRVLGIGEEPACWRDQTLFKSFQNYQKDLSEEESVVCMISGAHDRFAKNHPKGIISSAYGAKLISANDSQGFTYRGRFTDEMQAVTIGYQASQKANFALQWLAANQGVNWGGRTFLCWNPKGIRIPNPVGFDPWKHYVETQPMTDPSDYRRQLVRTIAGYRQELPDNADVILAAFEAATTGRLSVTYYSEQRAGDFLRRVEHWYDTCCMPNGKYGIQSPPLYDIAKFAFGVERSGKIELDEKVLREQVQRLLLCVTEQANIPEDLVRALRVRASRPQQYSNHNQYRIRYIACAVIRKYLNDKVQREEWTMVLDTEKTDRSYLFGRLLALLEYVERSTYKKDENRETNAMKMQSVFCERPMYAASVLDKKLNPYFKQLNPAMRIRCKNMIGEIYALLPQEEEQNLNRPLEDTYLLGYNLQRNALYAKKTESNNEEKEMED